MRRKTLFALASLAFLAGTLPSLADEPVKACGGIRGLTCEAGQFCEFPVETRCGRGDLRRFTLLHEESREHWKNWFRLAGEEEADVRAPGPMYADMALSKQAALLGHGVALVDLLYMQDELAAGTLIRPFATELNSGGYFLVARNLSKLSEPARIFADWIRAEFATSVAALSSTKGERSVLGAASGHIPSSRLSEPSN